MPIFKSKKDKDIVKKVVAKATADITAKNVTLAEENEKLKLQISENTMEAELNFTPEDGSTLTDEQIVDQAYKELTGQGDEE